MSSVSPTPPRHQYWLGGQGTADQRPLSFFVAEFGPTCLATHDKWFLTFSTNLLIYSSQCSTNWHFPLESLQGWDIGFKSSTRFMLSPSPMAAGTSYRKSTKKTNIAKGTKVPRVLPKKVHNNHPTTRSRFKALTKQIRSAAQLWQCCFQTVDELSAVAQLSQMILTTPTSTSANNQQLLSGHLYQPESHQSNLLNSSL